MPVHTYASWNKRSSYAKKKIDGYKKYFFICEGANTETFYFKRLIDQKKELGINDQIELCLWEKTGEDKDISYPKQLVEFAEVQKKKMGDEFESGIDKLIIVFDGDIFEEKVSGYEDLIETIENSGNVPAVTNPCFELFLLLHVEGSYEQYIRGNEAKYLKKDMNALHHNYAYDVLHNVTQMNAKKNKKIGLLADNVMVAIKQEKKINQDIHDIKGKVTSNVARIIEMIIEESKKDRSALFG